MNKQTFQEDYQFYAEAICVLNIEIQTSIEKDLPLRDRWEKYKELFKVHKKFDKLIATNPIINLR